MTPKNLLWLVFLLPFILGVRGGFRIKPTNTAVVKGSTARLTCQGEIMDFGVFWRKSDLGDIYKFRPTRLQHQYNPFTFYSTLEIENVKIEDAGVYQCTLVQSGLKAYAQLIVIDTDTRCVFSKDFASLTDGDSITSTCGIKIYSAVAYYPRMAWSTASGGSLTASTTISSDTVISDFTETLSCASNGRHYQVDTSFPAFDRNLVPDKSWDHSTEPVAYTYRYTSPHMVVFCHLTVVVTTPEKSTYYAGEVITCSSNGQAPVKYTWTGGMEQGGAELTIPREMGSHDMTLTCTATQDYNGKTYSASKEIQFTVGNLISNAQGHPRVMMPCLIGSFIFHALCKVSRIFAMNAL